MNTDYYDIEAVPTNPTANTINIEQLQHLITLLDHSDVSEIEVKRIEEGTRLVLRKAKASDGQEQPLYPVLSQPDEEAEIRAPLDTKKAIVARLVGIFHPWAKPRGKALVAVGDRIKAGQTVGTIQSLNIMSEVETPIAGRVLEILVQNEQPVEYGQQLMIIDTSEEK